MRWRSRPASRQNLPLLRGSLLQRRRATSPMCPTRVNMPEFTWPAVLLGAVLGIIFGASSLYLVLKVGMTVSASVPIAVLSITLFRAFSQVVRLPPGDDPGKQHRADDRLGRRIDRLRRRRDHAGPAAARLRDGLVRVMTVSVLGGLLGILMMIPLRRAFIVKQHGKLTYPEGTACAEVLIAGEKGGATARMVFIGFGIAVVHKFLTAACKLWSDEPSQHLYNDRQRRQSRPARGGDRRRAGAGVAGRRLPDRAAHRLPDDGRRRAVVLRARAADRHLRRKPERPVSPAEHKIDKRLAMDKGLIRNMEPGRHLQAITCATSAPAPSPPAASSACCGPCR